jgi:predicted nucleic acid-binding protein
MVSLLLDTTVIVDILRGYAPARQWIMAQQHIGVPAMVWVEILQGGQDKVAQARALKILQDFERVELITADVNWAIQQLTVFRLSHNVGGLDCLIAAPAYRLQLPLYTRNLKHFTPLLGSLAQKPY